MHDVGLTATLSQKKKTGVRRDKVRTEPHKIMVKEYLALRAGALLYLSFKLIGCLMRFPLKGLKGEPSHCMQLTQQGCYPRTAW